MISELIQNRRSKIRNQPGRSRLERQYFIVFGLLLGGGLITSGLLDVYFRYRENREQIEALQREVASGAATRIAQFVLTVESQLRAAAVSSALADKARLSAYQFELEKLTAVAPSVSEVTAIDASGKPLLFVSRFRVDLSSDEKDFSKAPGFLQAKQGANFFGPVYFLYETEPYMNIVVPIERFPGSVIGVLQAQVNLRHIWEVVRDLTVGDAGYTYIVTRAGRIIAHSDPGLVLQRQAVSDLPQVKAAFQPSPVVPKPRTLMSHDIDGQDVLSSVAFLPTLDWAVIVEQPLGEAYSTLYSSVFRTSALILVGLGIALVASAYVGRRVVRPLELLRRGVERIGAGDLDHRIEIKTGNEIEMLADEFNKMVGEIKNSYQSLEDKVRQRTKELTALLDVTATATQSLDFDQVLRRVAEKITEIFELDATRIYLFDRQREKLQRRAVFGPGAESYRESFNRGEGLVGNVAESGEPIIFEDIQTDPRYDELTHEQPSKTFSFRFFAIFPIKVRGGTLGAISCNSYQSRRLSPEEIRLINSLVDQIGPAIDNLNLFEEVKEKTAQLERTNRELLESLAQQTAVAGTLRAMANSPSNLQAVFDAIVADAARLTRATGGVIRLIDAAGVLRFVAHFRSDGNYSWQYQAHSPRPDENSATTRAMRERRAVQIGDIQNEGPEWRGPVDPSPWHSGLAIPLLQDREAIGVIVVFRDFVEPFTIQQEKLLTIFADQAVVAIKNATLLQQLQARTRELESANERLTELDKLKSGFISNVSHELRTPLTAIGSLVDNMLDGLTGVLNHKQIHYVSGIKDSTERLARLIRDLLDLSVIESGKIELKKAYFPLPSLSHEVAEVLQPVAQEKSIALFLPAMNGDHMAWADRDKITQVLTNLISNAIKFTPPAGRVELALETTGDGRWLQVAVRDTGPGIAQQEARLIFDEFYQINQPGREKTKGVGLGLAICKKLIDMHGGQIGVESVIGNGSTFYFTVPAFRTDAHLTQLH